ncbi:unnamed protein product [Linum trigynum]|uniref:Aminotransferase-like plant mobile domain-containing protein n=2 Tax=Linum trigynum TaxID=586398 RepID=A0AAV2G671_9ROSI
MSERRGKEKSRVLGRNVTVSERKKRQEESDKLREEERQEKISRRQAAVVPPPHSHVSQPLPGINTYDDMVEDDDSSDDECDVEGDDELSFHELLFDGHPGGSSDHVSTGSTHGSTVVGPLRGKDGRFASSSDGSKPSRKKPRDETWLLTEEAPGGPRDISLIPSFGGHIAHRLWTSSLDSRKMTVFQFYARQGGVDRLRTYEFGTPGAQALVTTSGLDHLSRCMMHNVDYPLLEAFIERWQPDTNTFHMPFGEMTITLHDVAFLLKIQVDGELLAAPARGDPSFVSGIVDLLK